MAQRVGSCSILLLLTAASCFNPSKEPSADATGSETTAGECLVGEVRCGCYPNGTCNAGLDCVSEVCVDLAAGTTTTTDGSTTVSSTGTGSSGSTGTASAETFSGESATSADEEDAIEGSTSSLGGTFASEASAESGSSAEGFESGSSGGDVVAFHIAGGPIARTPSLTVGDGAGFALLIRDEEGSSGSVAISGLSPQTAYPFYVTTQSCTDGDGGDIYLIDPSLGSVEGNVIQGLLETDANGAAMAVVPVMEHVARGDARSVVVIDPEDFTRLYCGEFLASSPDDPFRVHGSAGHFSGTDPFDARGDLVRELATGATVLQVSASGMTPSTEYHLHVRSQACAIDSGGPYYRMDWAQAEGDQANEIWLTFTTDVAGNAYASVTYQDHLARADAMSGEIHPAAGGFFSCMDFFPI